MGRKKMTNETRSKLMDRVRNARYVIERTKADQEFQDIFFKGIQKKIDDTIEQLHASFFNETSREKIFMLSARIAAYKEIAQYLADIVEKGDEANKALFEYEQKGGLL